MRKSKSQQRKDKRQIKHLLVLRLARQRHQPAKRKRHQLARNLKRRKKRRNKKLYLMKRRS